VRWSLSSLERQGTGLEQLAKEPATLAISFAASSFQKSIMGKLFRSNLLLQLTDISLRQYRREAPGFHDAVHDFDFINSC
jgi:hypothetical protein